MGKHKLSHPTLLLVALLLTAGATFDKGAAAQSTQPAKISYPATAKRMVSSEYFGAQVTEDYRWLENGQNPEVRAWVDAQNQLSHAILSAYPAQESIKSYLKQIYSRTSSTYYGLEKKGSILFAMKNQPPKEQPFLVTIKSPEDTTSVQVVVDPNLLDSTGGTAMDFYVPSNNGHLVAVSLSKGGSEDGAIHIFDVATHRELPDVIPHVNYPTAGGSLAWNADNSGVYYTRYPTAGERGPNDIHFFQQVYFHRLGTPISADQYQVGKEFPRIAEVQLRSSEDGKYVLATVSNGDGGEYAHFLQNPSGKWSQITQFSDKIGEAKFGLNQSLYMLSRKDAPKGKILQMPLTASELSQTKVVIPQSDEAISEFLPTAERLYVVDMVGGPMHIRVFGLDGTEQSSVPTEPISSVGSLTWTGGDEMLFEQQSYVHAPAWYRYSPSTSAPVKTAMAQKPAVNFDDTEVLREMVTSKDGTKVPINILWRKGTKRDRSNPIILYGYGGYNISETPNFSIFRRIWLDQGGVYVVANIRGGGEFGDAWHQQGNLTRKQNVFDDFAACAKYLIDSGYTSPSHLAIMGGSNGGLLMGAALTQHPELYRVVVSAVGIYDMLRVELFPNGEFNTTEFGTVKNKAEFDALYGYSPYHHVVDGRAYPAVLFLTGENDGRVDPANSRKMTARLQAATSSGFPILLRQSSTSGHGIGTSFSERIEQDGDVFSFLFSQLGIQYQAPH